MILVECDNDEALVRGLGFPRRGIEHHASKGRVLKALEKAPAGTVALVDEDPGAGVPGYFRQFQLAEHLPALRLRLYRHRSEPKWIVELLPDLEPWLIAAAGTGGVALTAFHLPDTARALHLNPKANARRLREWASTMLDGGSRHFVKLREWFTLAV